MKKFNKGIQKKYKENPCCPFCGSGEIYSGGFKNEGLENVWDVLFCDNCGKKWNEVYNFGFIEYEEEIFSEKSNIKS